MCLQDIAIGRRTYFRRTEVADIESAPVAIPADANRVGVWVAINGGLICYSAVGTSLLTTAWAQIGGGGAIGGAPLRIEQWGQLITAAIWVQGFTTGAAAVIHELLLEPPISQLAQEV